MWLRYVNAHAGMLTCYMVRVAAEKSTSQLQTGDGRSSSANLDNSVACRIVSNALEKCSEMTTIKGLNCSRLTTV